MPELLYCQFIIIEFVYDNEKEKYFPYFTFNIDEEYSLLVIGKDQDVDVEKLIERTANYAYRNLERIIEYSAVHKDEKMDEINLKDYLSVETKQIIGEENNDFALYDYINENKLVLVEGNDQIH